MGTLTLEQMEAEIRAFLGNRTDLDSRLDNIVNLAQMRIARLRDWEELQVLTSTSFGYTGVPADDKYLDAPTNYRKIRSLRLIDGANSRRLTGYAYNKFDQVVPDPERFAPGRPEAYTLWSQKFEFWPVPNSAYDLEIRYNKWPSTLVSGATSEFDHKDDIIIMLATSWAFLSLRDKDGAQKYWNIYKRMVDEAIGEDTESPDLIRPGILPRSASRGPIGQYYADPWVKGVM